ncbi:MAG: PAS domain S-box protein, partial [Anaerolineae bacterium]
MGTRDAGRKDSAGPAVADPALRQRAEEQARAMGVEDVGMLSPEAAQQLVHELRVHQIELEMQNEELRRTQEVLEASRARYFDLYDLAPVGYFTLSEQGLILEVNLTATTMLGVPRGALVKQPLTRSIIPEDEDIYYLHRRKLLETGTAQVCELRMARQHARVSQFWARLESIVVQDAESGAPVCHVTMSDVTERKGAERAVEQLAYDLGERVKELNCLFEISNLVEMPGISLEEVLQGTVDLIPPAWQYPEITCARIILDGQEYSTDSFAQSPWQQAADISVHGEPCGAVQVGYLQERPESDEGPFLKEERGLLNGIAERMGQVTERMRAQQQILQQQQFLGTVLDSLAYPFYVINAENYTVEVANRAAHTGSLRGDLTCFSLSHGRDQPCEPADHPCPLQEILITKEPAVAEHVHLTEDGRLQYVEVHGFPIIDSQGSVVQMIEYTLDITERKQAEEAVRKSETLLRETGRMAKVGGWELDPKDNSVAWTEEVYRIHEVPSDFQPNLESALSFYAPEDRPILEQAIGRAADTGEPWDLELGFITAKGKHLWVRAIGKAEHEDDGLVKLSGTFQDITERKQAEEALRESEMRWRSLTQTSPDHILMVDTDLRIQFANFASPGLAVEDLIGTPLYTLVDREKQAEVRAILEGAVKAGQPTRYETVYHPPEGEDIYYESHVTPRILSGTDEVVGLTVSSRDITAHKQAEQALRDSEERLRALFEILPLGVSVLDESRKIRLANPALGRILHLTHEQLLSGQYERRTYLRADGAEMHPSEFPTQRAFQEDRLVRDVEICVVMEDGERIWTNVSAVPLASRDWRVIATTTDITARKAAEAALVQARDELELRVQERTAALQDLNRALRAEIAERLRAEENLQASEERFRQLAENTEDIVWLMEPDSGQLLYVSPAWESILATPGTKPPETIGQLWPSVHPDDRETIPGSRSEDWLGQEVEFRVAVPDGSLHWIRARAFPIRNDAGQIYRLGGIASDITEEKEAFAAFVEAEQLAIAGRMAASLAHEINNPLQAAIGCLDLSLEQVSAGKDPHQHLQVTAQALDRASRVVAQLRALHYPLETAAKEPTDLDQLLGDMLILTQKRCSDQGVKVDWHANADLPPIMLVPDAMEQVC